MTVTLRDIAKALNLSISTISKALNDSHEIGSETKKKVLDYAKQHHYSPNRMAKGLKEGKSRSIGVVVCSLDNNVISQMLDGIHKASSDKSYQIIIMQSKESEKLETACIELLYAGGVDGILISPAYETINFSYLNSLQASGLPVVLFDRLIDQVNTHKVGADNFKGAYDATMHLIHNGYKNIAHLNTNTILSIATDRLNGYKQALEDSGIKYRPELLRSCNYTDANKLNEDLEQAIKYYMNLADKPDAIFTATDQISTRCLVWLNKLGYKIPDDVALIGFTNTELADAMNPALSTVHQPAFEIGQLAAEKLISLIERKNLDDGYETIMLPTHIKVRASSQPHSL
ncbi:LacI family transcriptional regulator [Pedobacter hiemivivus]|uniref:LacI family transcriptional regulator n=1 Tax=Pedobacter hiemivivus TaxID=2530454 RepID=A0A4U1G1N9_9SPHI|nr:LacI family DNA-binding transcriptional regulator [Pedobacter hiemivivus]TCC92760.1 LacI family transcriptional regulator [Pedobacter hiemivivus]TKC56173.1 LacI family transcriptional regulator [Pedobacter hiemivivus]